VNDNTRYYANGKLSESAHCALAQNVKLKGDNSRGQIKNLKV